MSDLDVINRQLSRATWTGCHPGVGHWTLVTRRSRVMTTVAALFAAMLVMLMSSGCLSVVGALAAGMRGAVNPTGSTPRHVAPIVSQEWCSEALPGTGTLTICASTRMECELERMDSQDMGPCLLR